MKDGIGRMEHERKDERVVGEMSEGQERKSKGLM